VDRGRGAGIVGESEMKGVTGKGTADFPLLHCKMDPQAQMFLCLVEFFAKANDIGISF
jgi:hypothetical protein